MTSFASYKEALGSAAGLGFSGIEASTFAAEASGFSLVRGSAEEWNAVKRSIVDEDGLDSWDAHDLMVALGFTLDTEETKS